jgi:hypothetical protein
LVGNTKDDSYRQSHRGSLKFSRARWSTFYKIRYVDYHLAILDQIYHPLTSHSERDVQNWPRAETHSIIFNLYSALDSLGYEINLAYKFRIKPSNIHIYHQHNSWTKDCLRCEFHKQNDNVTSSIRCWLGLGWFKIIKTMDGTLYSLIKREKKESDKEPFSLPPPAGPTTQRVNRI